MRLKPTTIRHLGAIWAAGFVLVLGGCSFNVLDQEANQAFRQSLGATTLTVYPAFVRDGDTPVYNAEAAEQVAEFFRSEQLADVTLSAAEVPITGAWGMNQLKMLQESADDFALYLAENPTETEYALLAEFLIGGQGVPVGIHCYVLDAQRRLAYVILLNSHHDVFADADPQTASECTAVLIAALREDLVEP